jgi:hypothetical protein
VPHLTAENHCEVLAQAAGKSKRDIEELVARLSPQPPVPDSQASGPRHAHVAGGTLERAGNAATERACAAPERFDSALSPAAAAQ